MALTTEQVRELWENYNPTKGIESFARSIEAEVRKQDEALIRQLVGALENSSDLVFKDTTKADARDLAITAGRARLEGKA